MSVRQTDRKMDGRLYRLYSTAEKQGPDNSAQF